MSKVESLEPCPFCGGEAEIIEIDEGENKGGSCVSCTVCQASSNVEFEFKENFVSNWNRRPAPSHHRPPVEALGVREAVGRVERLTKYWKAEAKRLRSAEHHKDVEALRLILSALSTAPLSLGNGKND